MGPPMPRVHPPDGAFSQSLREGKGVVRINRRVAGGRRMAYEMQDSQAMGPRHWLMSIYSVVKDPRRGKRLG
jgi:hypothetical protein